MGTCKEHGCQTPILTQCCLSIAHKETAEESLPELHFGFLFLKDTLKKQILFPGKVHRLPSCMEKCAVPHFLMSFSLLLGLQLRLSNLVWLVKAHRYPIFLQFYVQFRNKTKQSKTKNKQKKKKERKKGYIHVSPTILQLLLAKGVLKKKE